MGKYSARLLQADFSDCVGSLFGRSTTSGTTQPVNKRLVTVARNSGLVRFLGDVIGSLLIGSARFDLALLVFLPFVFFDDFAELAKRKNCPTNKNNEQRQTGPEPKVHFGTVTGWSPIRDFQPLSRAVIASVGAPRKAITPAVICVVVTWKA